MARILLVHLRKSTPEIGMPHLGLASLAAVLGQAGHEAVVFDEVLHELGRAPALAEVIATTQPDLLGFTSYTATRDRLYELMGQARRQTTLPILVGGPHATLFTADVVATGLADYVVQGEAEGAIVALVERAQRRREPEVVATEPPDVTTLPWPEYGGFLAKERIDTYPLLTSRGCPYKCSFCAVHKVATYRWRPREPQVCLDELTANLPKYPLVRAVRISDDCPTAKPERFKTFLRLLIDSKLGLPVGVDNLRADLLDAELVALLKQADSGLLCFGVESGNPEVFALVNKGETHEDIRRAARLTRAAGLQLALCFVIGLPGDNPQRHQDSIRLARELEPTLIFWNLAHPFPGTAMHQWFVDHGAQIDPPRTYTSYDTHRLACPEPTVSTADFSKRERRQAYLQAVLETDQYSFNRWAPWHLLRVALKYGLAGPALRSLGRQLTGRRRMGGGA